MIQHLQLEDKMIADCSATINGTHNTWLCIVGIEANLKNQLSEQKQLVDEQKEQIAERNQQISGLRLHKCSK